MPETSEDQLTPVDDVRRIRERLWREAGGDIRVLSERARKVAEQYREKLNLKRVSAAEDLPGGERSAENQVG